MHDHEVILHTVGVYSINTDTSSQTQVIRAALEEVIEQEPYVLQTHGLYVDNELKGATFDLVISFEAGDRNVVRTRVVEKMHVLFPDYAFVAVIDSDISD